MNPAQVKPPMPSIIRLLDEETINQIKAGEVIENPASVVKELVENALDASSQNIHIEIAVGGRRLIRIVDDGCGMSQDDTLLAIERHATSKIRSVDDLSQALTMGFRGEALPSIASISKMKIITRQKEASTDGCMLLIEGGKVLQQNRVPTSCGTSIEIQSLFFNVPARRKFQKSIEKDIHDIEKTVKALALANPHISFQLVNDQKLFLKTNQHPSTSFLDQLKERIRETLGNDFLQELCPISFQEGPLSIQGFLSKPSFTRSNRTGGYLFINQRAVYCPLIANAILEGYGTLLSTRRYPCYVLHIHLPPSEIDVNVHPQKKEIRIRREALLRKQIIHHIQKTFQQKESPSFTNTSFLLPWEEDTLPPLNNNPNNEFFRDFFAGQNTKKPEVPLTDIPSQKEWSTVQQLPSLFTTNFHKTPSYEPPPSLFPVDKIPILALYPPYIILDAKQLTQSQASCIHHDTYPLEGVLFIHQGLAHKRVIYDSIISKKPQGMLSLQDLLLPFHFEFTHSEAEFLKEHLEELNELGFQMRYFGKQTFIVERAIPSLTQEMIHALLQDFLSCTEEIREGKRKKEREMLAKAIAKSSLKSTMTLSYAEAEVLVLSLFQSSLPNICPFGHPTFFYLAKSAINKRLYL